MHNRTAPSVRCQTSSASHLRLHAHRNISQSLTVKTASSSFSNYVNNFQQRCLRLGARDSGDESQAHFPGLGEPAVVLLNLVQNSALSGSSWSVCSRPDHPRKLLSSNSTRPSLLEKQGGGSLGSWTLTNPHLCHHRLLVPPRNSSCGAGSPNTPSRFPSSFTCESPWLLPSFPPAV